MTDPVISALAAGREPAPAGVLPAVLLRTGVADGYVRRDGPIGPVFVAFNRHGISACRLGDDRAGFEAEFQAEFGRRAVPAEALPRRLERGVARALESGRLGRLPLDLRSRSEFAAAVLRKTAEIPPGEVRPYGWVAREIGKPAAVRAVGTALNGNPVPVLVPCHRVVRSDGRVGEYAYGPETKRRLLAAEGLDPSLLDDTAARGVRFTGSDTSRIYCHPTCRHARRVTAKHTVEFRSAVAAAAAGYRPCLVCRPQAA